MKALVDIYANWIPKEKILTTNVWSSELAKLASNAMLAQRISSINSLSALCEKTGADIDELSKSIGMDQRIGPKFLKASVGFGGSCFQKDILNLVYLCKHYGLDEVAEYWHGVIKINDYQKNRFAQKIIDGLGGDVLGKKIAILGWAFKSNTNDSRESPAIYVTKKLVDHGAQIKIFDPLVSSSTIIKDLEDYNIDKDVCLICSNIDECIDAVELVAILTETSVYKDLGKNAPIYDGRGINKKAQFTIGK